MRKVIWKLSPGGKKGQELYDDKVKKGLEYIKKLGDEVEEVITEPDRLVIHLKD